MKALAFGAALAFAGPALAQMHDMAGMPGMAGMAMPAKKHVTRPPSAKAARPAAVRAPATDTEPVAAIADAPAVPGAADCPPAHAAMGHCTAPAPPAAMPAIAPGTRAGTDQEAGDTPPPTPPANRAADAFYDPARMAAADRRMRAEHGGMTFSRVLFNLAEMQVRRGRDGYRWDGEGWFGGDINRVVVKSEGEGTLRDRVEAAEVQALYARAIDPYWNLQAGVRQDLGAGAKRTYATIGVEGLAPYWFDVEGTLFLSDRGEVLARGEAWIDQRVTQRTVLQPRIELNLAAQDSPANRIGAGLSSAELGLRLRHEIAREFAPYVGVSWERRYGTTARYARAAGKDDGGFALALGVRAWF